MATGERRQRIAQLGKDEGLGEVGIDTAVERIGAGPLTAKGRRHHRHTDALPCRRRADRLCHLKTIPAGQQDIGQHDVKRSCTHHRGGEGADCGGAVVDVEDDAAAAVERGERLNWYQGPTLIDLLLNSYSYAYRFRS